MEAFRLGRLRRAREILKVLKGGRRVETKFFILYWQVGEGCRARAAFVAGKDVGKAVARNRARRLLREALRGFLPLLPCPLDMVLVASPRTATASLWTIREAMGEALRAAGLVYM